MNTVFTDDWKWGTLVYLSRDRDPSKFHQSKWSRKPIDCRKKQWRMHNMAKSIQQLQVVISYDFFITYYFGGSRSSNIFLKKIGVSKVSLGVVPPWSRWWHRSWEAKHHSFDSQCWSTWDRRFWKLGPDDSGVTIGYKTPGFLTGKAMWLQRPLEVPPNKTSTPDFFVVGNVLQVIHSEGLFIKNLLIVGK